MIPFRRTNYLAHELIITIIITATLLSPHPVAAEKSKDPCAPTQPAPQAQTGGWFKSIRSVFKREKISTSTSTFSTAPASTTETVTTPQERALTRIQTTDDKIHSPSIGQKLADRFRPESPASTEMQLTRESNLTKSLMVQDFMQENHDKSVKKTELGHFLKSAAIFGEQLQNLLDQPKTGLKSDELTELRRSRQAFPQLIVNAFRMEAEPWRIIDHAASLPQADRKPLHEDVAVAEADAALAEAEERRAQAMQPDPSGHPPAHYLTPEIRADLADQELADYDKLLRVRPDLEQLSPGGRALDWMLSNQPTDQILTPEGSRERDTREVTVIENSKNSGKAEAGAAPALPTYSLFHKAMHGEFAAVAKKYFVEKHANYRLKDSAGKTPVQYLESGAAIYPYIDDLVGRNYGAKDEDSFAKESVYRRGLASSLISQSEQITREAYHSPLRRNRPGEPPADNLLVREMLKSENQFVAKLIHQGDPDLFDSFTVLGEFNRVLNQIKNPDGSLSEKTALDLAAESHNLPIFERISRRLPNLLKTDDSRDSPLQTLSATERGNLRKLAHSQKNAGLLAALDQADAVAQASNAGFNRTELQAAARLGNLAAVQRLIPRRKSRLTGKIIPNKYNWDGTEDQEGRSLMHLAVMSRQLPLVRWLLATKGSSLSRIDKENETPLHLAAINGDLAIVKLLLDSPNDLDLYQKDRNGRTAIDLLAKVHPYLAGLADGRIKTGRPIARKELAAAVTAALQHSLPHPIGGKQ